MPIRLSLPFLAGLFAGAAAVATIGGLVRRGDAPAATYAAAPGMADPGPAAGPEPEGPALAGMGSRDRGGAPGAGGSGDGEVHEVPLSPEVLEAVGRLRIEDWDERARRSHGEGGRESSLWYAVATVDAIAGDVAATEAALSKAVRLEPDAERLVEVLAWFDAKVEVQEILRVAAASPQILSKSFTLVRTLLSAEAVPEAIALAEMAYGPPAKDAAWGMYGTMALIGVDAAKADEVFRRHEAAFDGEQLAKIAARFLNDGEKALARAWLDRARAKGSAQPSDGDDSLSQLVERLDPASAIGALRDKAKGNPENAGAWAALATACREAGDSKGAFEALAAAVRLEPSNGNRLAELLQLDPAAALPVVEEVAQGSRAEDVLTLLGRAYLRNGRMAEGAEAMFRAQERAPTSYDLLKAIVDLDPQRALGRLNELVARPAWSRDDEVLGARANALMAVGDGPAAFDAYVAAHAADAVDPDWLQGLVRADPVRATGVLEAQRRDVPEDKDVMGALADAYAATGRKEEAVPLYMAAIEKAGAGSRWLVGLAKVDAERGLALARKDTVDHAKDGDAWCVLGDVYKALGRAAEARAAYDEALRVNPRDTQLELRRAQVR